MNHSVFPENPYAAPAAIVADAPTREQELAGRGTRLAAVFLDGLFLGLAMVPLFVAMALAGGAKSVNEFETGVLVAIGLGVLLILGLIAWNCVLLSRNGQTVAKMLLGIRVVRRDGSHCGLARIFFARYLPVSVLGAIPIVGGLVSLVDAMLIFRDDRRCLHD